MNILTNTTLVQTKKWSIDDFLKLKPIIFEYCINLTATKNSTSWCRNTAKAEDLYHDVYLYVHDNYFNKSKPEILEGKFIQIMKNCTYWTFYRSINPKYSKNIINNNLNYFEDSGKSMFLFESLRYEDPKVFQDIKDHPDYEFYMKYLNPKERLAIDKLLEGYTKSEIARMFDKTYSYIPNIVRKIEANSKLEYNKRIIRKPIIKEIITNNFEYVKSKVINWEKIFIDKKYINMYSMYLQKINHRIIAQRLGKSVSQVNVEIFRINKKIKYYDRTL